MACRARSSGVGMGAPSVKGSRPRGWFVTGSWAWPAPHHFSTGREDYTTCARRRQAASISAKRRVVIRREGEERWGARWRVPGGERAGASTLLARENRCGTLAFPVFCAIM